MDLSGVVSIVKTNNEGTKSIGTGFFIRESGLILTCYHVLKKSGCYDVGDIVGIMFEGKPCVISAILTVFDAELDVAIINTDIKNIVGYDFFVSDNPDDSFDTLGFPNGSLSGVVAHPLFERKTPDGLIELKNSNDISLGFSGAPLFDTNGLVVGMIRNVPNSIRQNGSLLNVARAIPIESIIEKFQNILSGVYKEKSKDFNYISAFDESLKNKIKDKNILRKRDIEFVDKPKQNVFSEINIFTNSYKGANCERKEKWESQDIDKIAEETFKNLMQIWLDKTDADSYEISDSNSLMIDFIINLPSMKSDMSSIKTFWKVKSSSYKLEKTRNSKLDVDCFYLNFSKEDIYCFREIAQQYSNYYLVFAHNSLSAKPSELYQHTPQERFEWYCIDIKQYLEENAEEKNIIIPDCNIFNLSTFSLLWSSLWVSKFYHPLYNSTTIEIPNLMDTIRLTHPYKNESLMKLGDWNSLKEKLSVCEKELGKDEYSKIAFPLGIGYALEVIKNKLYDTSSNLTTILNYCPESLYGTANLWLFSRSYHGFMTASGQVVNFNQRNKNLRILPLPDNPENISGLIKVCLWHIVLLYSSLNVEVRVIYRPSYDAGVDHSYYGGGIGYFPWLSLSDDGITWMMEDSIDTTNGEHRDFIYEHMDNQYIHPYHSNILEIATIFNLHINDLNTAPRCPILLFPKEGRFIEYPHSIFGNNGFRSINSLKLRLS